MVVVAVGEHAGRMEGKARIREVVAGDTSTPDHVAAAAAVGRDMLAAGSADTQGASMDGVVVAAGADWSATAHVPWTRHWRAAEEQEPSSRD